MTDPKVLAWAGCSTLEEFFRRCLEQGKEEQCLALIRSLPEESKKKYREIWKQVKDKK